jgi:hypothetical protein
VCVFVSFCFFGERLGELMDWTHRISTLDMIYSCFLYFAPHVPDNAHVKFGKRKRKICIVQEVEAQNRRVKSLNLRLEYLCICSIPKGTLLGRVEGTQSEATGSQEAEECAACSRSEAGEEDKADESAGSWSSSDTEGPEPGGEGEHRREGPKDKATLREERKAHKKEVKEANRERRLTKTPKHVKKRAEKKHKRK